MMTAGAAYADGTAPCNTGAGINSVECGENSTAVYWC